MQKKIKINNIQEVHTVTMVCQLSKSQGLSDGVITTMARKLGDYWIIKPPKQH